MHHTSVAQGKAKNWHECSTSALNDRKCPSRDGLVCSMVSLKEKAKAKNAPKAKRLKPHSNLWMTEDMDAELRKRRQRNIETYLPDFV